MEHKKDFLLIVILAGLISLIALFNYIVDPYYIFRDSTINGFNNVKLHKYSSKRTFIYSDIKLNSKNKNIVFTGNCLLSHYGSGLNNVAFFTIPVARVSEVSKIIKNITEIAPNTETIYWGLFMDDFLNMDSDEYSDTLPDLDTKNFTLNDFINLFFSWNTTKYSIETVKESIKNKGQDIIYVYPYREIAKKEYDNNYSIENISTIKDTIDYVKKKNIELIIYYSPIHISKKIHIYTKNKWDLYLNIKRALVEITELYDYSFLNEYNYQMLDENNTNFIDNIHPTNIYNNIVVNDLLSNKKTLATILNKENIEEQLKKDTAQLEKYMKKEKELTQRIKNVSKNDYGIKTRSNKIK